MKESYDLIKLINDIEEIESALREDSDDIESRKHVEKIKVDYYKDLSYLMEKINNRIVGGRKPSYKGKTLKQIEKEVIYAYLDSGLTKKEIANILDISPKTVYKKTKEYE